MTVDEAIEFHKRASEELFQRSEDYKAEKEYSKQVREDAKKHKQEEEWLEELKELRKFKEQNMSERESIEHELKILPQFYNAVASHRKTFEIRKDDRDYQVGDIILLREFDGENYTNRQTKRVITYILRDSKEYGLADGYCILGIRPIWWNEALLQG